MKDEDSYCRSATKEDLKLLLKALNDNHVEYFLIGGYALLAHGYERATTDIDILVPATKESGERVIRALMLLPDQVAKDINPGWFVDAECDEHGTIRVADEFLVDVMFNACGQTYATLKQHAETVDLDGIAVHTVDLNGLLKTKQTVRAKDIADRAILERAIDAYHQQSIERSSRGAVPRIG